MSQGRCYNHLPNTKMGGTFLSRDWMVLLQEQNQLSKVVNTKKTTEQFGLSLTEQEARLILEERKNSLTEQKRVEFGEGIATK